MTLPELSPLELSGGAKKKKLVKKSSKSKSVKKGTAKKSKSTAKKSKSTSKKSKSKSKSKSVKKGTAKKSKSKSKRSKSKQSKSKQSKSKKKSKSKRSKSKRSKSKKNKDVFGNSKEVQRQLRELQELERDILNKRSIEKSLQREQQVENMRMYRQPRISEQDITNIEPIISSSSWEEHMSPNIESEVYIETPALSRTRRSSSLSRKKSLISSTPYLSPALERIPTPYVPQQTNFTPPPAYIADEDALEPTASPITVFGAEKEDLSYRK